MRCIAEPDVLRAPIAPLREEAPPATLRQFRPADVPYLVPLVAEALREHYDPSLYVSLSEPWPEGFLVAADPSDVPLAFLLGIRPGPGEARVLMFAVGRPQRDRGVGTLLMSAFLERCRRDGLTRVTLEVRVSNATAIRFYTRFRFSVVDLLRRYYSDGEDGYQMARELP